MYSANVLSRGSRRFSRLRNARPAKRGRVLAVKWGLNPNSSSLGVDVTFLLFGSAALALATPFVSALLRMRRPGVTPASTPESTPPIPGESESRDDQSTT